MTTFWADENEADERRGLFATAKDLIKQGLPVEEITDITGLAEVEVQELVNRFVEPLP